MLPGFPVFPEGIPQNGQGADIDGDV